MNDAIEVYVQPGKHGLHAGGRSPCVEWAAHRDDEETAAWRCALRHWFPKRPNGVLLYSEARAITVEKIGQHEYKATLTLPNGKATTAKLKRAITPALLDVPPKPTKPARRARRTKAKK